MELKEIKSNEVFTVDMMYAGTNNMLRTNIYGRVGLGNRCFVCADMYACLQKVAPQLQQRGLKLKICDAYRPPLAHQMMKEIIPMPGFFAAEAIRSQHCHASAVDVCLVNAATGQELDFPCKVAAGMSSVTTLKKPNIRGTIRKTPPKLLTAACYGA